MALNTDKFKKLSRRLTTQIGAAGVADAVVTTIPLSSTTNFPTGTAVVIVVDRVDVNGTATPTLEESAIGVVSGSNLVTCVRGVEGTAQAHNAGAVVEILFTAIGWNDLIDGLLTEHNQLGGHTNITACNVTASGTLTVGGVPYTSQGVDGWTSNANTWTYSSVDGPTGVVTINADLTALIQVGDRIKFTNTTLKYFIVSKTPTFGAGVTTVTFYGGTDYALVNAAITSPSYSHGKAPFGFNPDPSKWSETLSDAADRSASPSTGVWTNLNAALTLSIPIGVWRVWYSVVVQANTTTSPQIFATLSTANNTESDPGFSSLFSATAAAALNYTASREKVLVLTTKTPYFLNNKYAGTASLLSALGSTYSPTIIKAVSALL